MHAVHIRALLLMFVGLGVSWHTLDSSLLSCIRLAPVVLLTAV